MLNKDICLQLTDWFSVNIENLKGNEFQIMEVLLENKNVKNIIFDIPCISLNEYEQIQQQYETEKERKLQTLVRIGGVKQTYDIQSQKDLYANKFLQFITKEDLEFFNDTVLEKNKQAFRTSDTQRTVFVPHNLIAKAEPIYSLLYYIIKTENKSHTNVNIVLGQQNKEKNIIKLALQFDMKQVQKIFEQVRLESLQNQLNWVHQVGNRGCMFCNDDIDNNDGPNTSEELLKNHKEYNIQNTGFFVTSILNTMAQNPSDKNFLAYTYKDNTYDIINSIIELTQDYEQMVDQNNENMKEFLSKEKKFEQKKIKQEQYQNMLHSELKSNLLDQLEVENDDKLIDEIISEGNQDEFNLIAWVISRQRKFVPRAM
ncbi:hypothetical protein PPERSA_00920 [Pseudocohnilembus persalinus]|uniref:Uncharacterized protein n=1 Tax=Pseudocohnilembus persalinus TaxID=266149 RepID=A0A0V0QES5_PSEPJ|nr:hypothetical protein PPERSA_00920 [Pseudocohnilembus persalinus]|eukprot:KRX00693.1 hypothetical protein PPERSA_00920 [Pseudocohnilembus persalinus]